MPRELSCTFMTLLKSLFSAADLNFVCCKEDGSWRTNVKAFTFGLQFKSVAMTGFLFPVRLLFPCKQQSSIAKLSMKLLRKIAIHMTAMLCTAMWTYRHSSKSSIFVFFLSFLILMVNWFTNFFLNSPSGNWAIKTSNILCLECYFV